MNALQRLHLEWCQAHAATRGGACLSDRYFTREGRLEWRCALGHTWAAGPRMVVEKGTWCPTCGHARRARRDRAVTLEAVRAIAVERGGACLSPRYVGNRVELRCARGHVFRSVPHTVMRGGWCRRCAMSGVAARVRERKFASLKACAERRGGECLSTAYVNVWAKLRWRCAEGHEWEAAGKQVGDGAWCPRCAGVAKHTLAEMQAIAASRGGRCLAETYVDANTPLLWSCAQGHQWKANASNVIHQSTWCRRCRGTPRGRLERLQRIAGRHGGRCLSSEDAASGRAHLWRCDDGHEWRAKTGDVRRGRWCPRCAEGPATRPRRRHGFE